MAPVPPPAAASGLEGQWYETVFDPVGLVVSRVEGVAILPTLAALPHSPLRCAKIDYFIVDDTDFTPTSPPASKNGILEIQIQLRCK